MISEEEKLRRELDEARAALEYRQQENKHRTNEMFELEAKIQIEVRDDLLHMQEETLEQRVERLERDLEDLENGWE